ncbi:MAG TPA: hypothetical protein VHW00_00385 [Thermoanaerobaculia bacterium]|nr:hypothetical protein [Thermoanaerobaculia bacterium]
MTARSLRTLLAHLVDYAGLFPPAALTMQDAVRNYARYRESEFAWMLGSFVVPKERAKEVPAEFPMSVLGVHEIKANSVEEVNAIEGTGVEGTGVEGTGVYVEITDLSLLDAIANKGLRAKMRTGGLTEEAFPTSQKIADFLRACKARGVAFKATAGLHHPLRCVRSLTYEPNAPTGLMHGFINVFLAAALLDDAEAVLEERDAEAFAFDDDGARWRDRRVRTQDLEALRRDFAISFGSCSFEEPIDDLRALHWL